MRPDNLGWKPNDALFRGEANAPACRLRPRKPRCLLPVCPKMRGLKGTGITFLRGRLGSLRAIRTRLISPSIVHDKENTTYEFANPNFWPLAAEIRSKNNVWACEEERSRNRLTRRAAITRQSHPLHAILRGVLRRREASAPWLPRAAQDRMGRKECGTITCLSRSPGTT